MLVVADLINILNVLISSRIGNITLREVSELIWCYARLNCKTGLLPAREHIYQLVQSGIAKRKTLRATDFGMLCKLLWSLAVLDELTYEVQSTILDFE
jgi:hypothetical protein